MAMGLTLRSGRRFDPRCVAAVAFFVIGVGISIPVSAFGGDELRVASPDGDVVVQFMLQSDGVPAYSVEYKGKQVIEPSRLGLEPDLLDDFELVNVTHNNVDTSWTNEFGELRTVPDKYHEIHCDLKHESGMHLRITFRAYDEGAALRYSFPDQETKDLVIDGERTEFRFPPETYGYEEHGTEGPYKRVPTSNIQPWCERPLTLEFQNGSFASLGEAANFDYPRMLLSPLEGVPGALVSALGGRTSNTSSANQRHDPTARLAAGDTTPWRVLIVGESPGELLEKNYLLLNLCPPCALDDTSWIKPGKVMRETTLTTANAKAVIDFAETAGIAYVHFDAGWYGPENDRRSDATEVAPARIDDLDLRDVVRYATAKGVGVFVYVNRIALKQQLDTLLPLYREMGLKGIKFGFVDVGPQAETSWITESLKKAADHQLMINIHDGYRANGINRTFPNLMTVEGIRGNEHMPTAEHNCTLPFTRYVGGIGDYTVCYYNNRIQTTHAHQLAMAVVSFSPLQWIFWYDKPDMYRGEPEIEFFRAVPTVWDETRVIHGKIGEYATIARRRGDEWFVGTINGSNARSLQLPFHFLDDGRQYLAHIYYDDGSQPTRTKVGVSKQTVTSATKLNVELKPAGGQAIWIRPATTEHDSATQPASEPLKTSIYHDGWIDLNKNGEKDPYEDSSYGVESRVEDLLARMTVDEKTAQMATLYGFPRVLTDELPTEKWLNAVWKDGIGNIDEHANGNTNYGRPIADPESDLPHSRHAQTMNEVQRFFVERTRLGIPADFTNEAARGLLHTHATSFPSQLGVASAWNPELVTKIGRVVAREARALGYTHIYAPILDLPRDPRWGRTCECYSEDPYLTAELGVAMAKALQRAGVASTCKHFAVYGTPNGGRDGAARVDPQVTWRDVEAIHLYPFRRVVRDAGILGIMASYNDYDGVPIQASRKFLTEILREQWGFNGYVVSDSGAVADIHRKHCVAPSHREAVRMAVEAGLNVRTDFNRPENFVNPLSDLVNSGDVLLKTIDARVRDVLRVKFLIGLFDHPYVERPDAADVVVGADEHRAIAAQAARESIVLLKNEGRILPLSKQLKKVLVTGPLAHNEDAWWDRYGPQRLDYVTPLEGIREKLGPDCDVRYVAGCSVVDDRFPESDIYREPPSESVQREINSAVEAARDVDVIIAVLGEDEDISREDRSRISLDLPGHQDDLLRALHATGKPMVLVLSSGRPIAVNWADDHVPAILEMWFSNQDGGHAIADVLFGDYNPAGRLPVTFPRSVGQIPIAFPYRVAAQARDGGQVSGPLYPFGHGLSYTSYTYANLRIVPAIQTGRGDVEVLCEVTNSGDRAGDEIVQLYLRDDFASLTMFEKRLSGFERLHLEPDETKTVRFRLTPDHLATYVDGQWTVEPGMFTVMIGTSSTDVRLEGRFEMAPQVATVSQVEVDASQPITRSAID